MNALEHAKELTVLEDAIIAGVCAAIPEFKTVTCDELEGNFDAPAAQLSLTFADNAEDLETYSGKTPYTLRYQFAVLVTHRGRGVGRSVRECMPEEVSREQLAKQLAFALSGFIHGQRFGVELLADAKSLRIERDVFAPEFRGYEAWSVEFTVSKEFGEYWIDLEGETPEAKYSLAPDIGVDHEADYTDVSAAPELAGG